jgi:cell shape-determining protein MreD
MNALKWIVLALLVFLLQTQFYFMRYFSNLTVILVYYFGLKSQQRNSDRDYSGSKAEFESVAFGVIIGLMEDVISGSIIGPGLLSKGLLGLMTPVVFTDMIFKWTPLWGAIVIIIFTLFDGMVVVCSRIMFTGIHVSGATLFQAMFVQSIMNIPFGIFLLP